jgi:hypothetical protein
MVASETLFAKDREQVDIETTLADSFVALGQGEAHLRLLNPVFTWIEVHAAAVIVEKLLKVLVKLNEAGEDISYGALAARFALSKGHRKWAVLQSITAASKQQKTVGPPEMSESLLKLRGEEEWSRGSGFTLPRGVIGTDSKWTLSREALAAVNRQYRNRLIYGPQWRADIVTAVERGATTAAEASRLSGASYEPCHRILDELAAAGKFRRGKRRTDREHERRNYRISREKLETKT